MQFNEKNYQINILWPGDGKLQFYILDQIIKVGNNAMFDDIKRELIDNDINVISLDYCYKQINENTPEVEIVLRYNDSIIEIFASHDESVLSSDLSSWYYKDAHIYFECEKSNELQKIEDEINKHIPNLISDTESDCILLQKME